MKKAVFGLFQCIRQERSHVAIELGTDLASLARIPVLQNTCFAKQLFLVEISVFRYRIDRALTIGYF